MRQHLNFLRLMARPGSTVVAKNGGALVRATLGGKIIERCVDAQTWQWGLSAGVVFTSDDPDVWQLSKQGRLLLRRELSSTGAGLAKAKKPPPEVAAKPQFDAQESPLAWLARRKDKSGAALISPAQLRAGERLRSDFSFAQMMPRLTVNWENASLAKGRRSAPGVGVDIHDGVMAAGERVRRALSAVGPELSGILIDVCCHLKGLEMAERQARWPQRSARVVLLLALSALARHYGFDQEAPSGSKAGRTIRHWGAEGYRPTIDAGADT